MGEIDRINPIVRSVPVIRTTDHVQPGSDRGHHREEPQHDELELSNTSPVEEPEVLEETPDVEPDHGLDIAV